MNKLIEEGFVTGVDNLNDVTMVSSEDLQYKFYNTLDDILIVQNSNKYHEKVFEKKTFLKNYLTAIMTIISLFIATIIPLYNSASIVWFSLVATIFLFLSLYIRTIGSHSTS